MRWNVCSHCNDTVWTMWTFWKITRLLWLNFQVLDVICYLLDSSLLCSYSVTWGR